ncbi:MAG: ATP-binding cassette domain-containing protein, partial [Vampirovibrio sp.]|nr:ATP-binding cassette domain-containing protein [Vampirovibrio sp.]
MPPLKDHLSLQLQDISKSFATHTLFEGLSLQIGAKSRIGLIGKNGCGKSTLLKIIMGELEPNEGTITRAPGLRINYLTQEPKITPGLTLEQEMQSVFDELNDLTAKEAEIIEEYNQEGLTEDDYMVLAEKLDAVHQEMARLDAGSMDARIGKILKGLGFEQADHQRQTTDFSGGWQMRVNLAKILLEDTDVLLMDEPTNHLDMDACEWLEGFLNEYPGGIVLVSHDRRFLDQVTTHIADLEGGKIRVWT